MRFLVNVRVNLTTMLEFGQKLKQGELDRSCIRGETYCIKNDPAVGYSIWEAESRQEFDEKFSPWKKYYEETDIREVIDPNESMRLLMEQTQE
ncbi:hypothetical protein [Pseudobacteroides cellulosolvens]|uniref:Uncharacterized protein n=1 Tax=Pseudobacteroides cellulosolvens ATCC 35603 = DSM 2933 TaxID=398512 RepID=A0A0L6JVH2_9FIRM|nr:hypothetical protein [Pseudobacteroides cellulosolvens]KNY29828.1 hypothetical protein Bccel_5105 [Pseudobacteroides cellulosolvens ATCC 35603 = DSM 2933]